MDKGQILDFLDKTTDVLKAAAPIASTLGVPFAEQIAGWADTAVAVGKNALERAEEGKFVLDSDDKVAINLKIAELEAANAALNAEIEAS